MLLVPRYLVALVFALGGKAVADEGLSNVVLVKEFPLSVLVKHGDGKTFLEKTTLRPEELETLKTGQTLVRLGATEASPLPAPQNSQETNTTGDNNNNDYIVTYLKSHLSSPSKIKPKEGYDMLDGIGPTMSFYGGWKPEEVLAFNSYRNKRHISEYLPLMNYMTTGELILEASESSKEPPVSHSNRPLWESKGLKARKQDGSNCGLFAATMAGDILLIKAGYQNPKADPNFLWRSQRDKAGRFEATEVLSIAESLSAGNVQCLNNNVRLNRRPQIRNILGLKKDPSEFPLFVRKLLGGSPNKDHRDGYFQTLIKKEISEGRPLILGLSFPDGRIFDKKHKRDGNQEIIIRPKAYAGKSNPHSVVVVGYKPDPENPEHLLLEILNTAGPDWGNKGYAWVSTAYLDLVRESPISIEVYSID